MGWTCRVACCANACKRVASRGAKLINAAVSGEQHGRSARSRLFALHACCRCVVACMCFRHLTPFLARSPHYKDSAGRWLAVFCPASQSLRIKPELRQSQAGMHQHRPMPTELGSAFDTCGLHSELLRTPRPGMVVDQPRAVYRARGTTAGGRFAPALASQLCPCASTAGTRKGDHFDTPSFAWTMHSRDLGDWWIHVAETGDAWRQMEVGLVEDMAPLSRWDQAVRAPTREQIWP